MTLTDKLFANRLLDTAQAVKDFEAAIQELGLRNVVASDLPSILRCFDDKTNQYDVMWALVHLVEQAPPQALVEALLEESVRMSGEASEWLFALVARVLNTPEHCALFTVAFPSMPKEIRIALNSTLARVGKSRAAGAPAARMLLSLET